MIVDVVVLNYNSGEVITRCIESLLKFDNINIIVVDNGSLDKSITILKNAWKGMRFCMLPPLFNLK